MGSQDGGQVIQGPGKRTKTRNLGFNGSEGAGRERESTRVSRSLLTDDHHPSNKTTTTPLPQDRSRPSSSLLFVHLFFYIPPLQPRPYLHRVYGGTSTSRSLAAPTQEEGAAAPDTSRPHPRPHTRDRVPATGIPWRGPSCSIYSVI